MKKVILHFTIVLVTLFFFQLSSCKKNEEGPVVSLKNKKERIINIWKAEKIIENGKDNTSNYYGFEMTFTKEGDYFRHDQIYSSYIHTGTWTLVNEKNDIQIFTKNYDGVSMIKIYKILRLKENEMWLRDEGNVEYYLIPQEDN